MATITLNDIPEDLLARLQTAALRERRSLDQEAIVLIEGGLAARETAGERAERQVAAWSDFVGGWVSDLPFEAEVAALYTARTSGRDFDL
jgi:hypothetical protein